MEGRAFLAIAFVLSILSGYSCDEENEDWWKHMQLYQIYPRSFKDSDGDGIGDINGIRSKLQHLADIGVNATWLSPVYPSPMVDFGYDIADYYDIAEEYGTIADLEALIAEAKEKNIRILLDFVPNHTSDKNEWFVKSVNRVPGFEDFYVWHDGRDGGASPPSNWISVFRGPAWTFHPVRNQWYLHQFAKEQPDLNYRDPLVVEEMKNVLKFWLAKGVAGFRVDAIPHLVEADVDASGNYPDEPLSGNTNDPESYDYLDHLYTRERDLTYEIVYDWRATFEKFAEDTGSETIVLLMEAMSDVELVMKYYGNGTSEGAHFPFNFNLAFLGKSANARVLEDNIVGWFNNLPEGRVTNWVVGNHDQPRLATRFGPERSDGIVMIAMLLPGVAVTYNGEEIAMENFYLSWEDTVDPQGCNAGIDLFNGTSRDPERTPFQWDDTENSGFSTANKTWLPVASNYLELNLAKQTSDERSAYKFYKELSNLRQKEIIHHGNVTVKALSDDILAFTRVKDDEGTIVVVVNNGASAAAGVNLQNSFQGVKENLSVLISSVNSARRPGQTVQSSNFVLQPYEALALQ